MIRTGLIHNPLSHRNRLTGGGLPACPPQVLAAAPETPGALERTLREFSAQGVELLVLDGGDGGVREALSRLPDAFGSRLPRLAVLPSGKTNALARDLGVPGSWSLQDAMAAAHRGATSVRRPLEVVRAEGVAPQLRGFIFGAGAFVKATVLAQRTHQLGAFGGLAIALTLAGAVGRTLFGGPGEPWREGTPIRIAGLEGERRRFLLLASTLRRLPLGLKPFGPPRDGLKLLAADAPPRRLLAAAPVLMTGGEHAWLGRAGYHRLDAEAVRLFLEGEFVLDGEIYPGGELTIRTGPALEFVRP